MDPLFERARSKIEKVRRVTLVASGKGGVGKSIVSSSIALVSASRGLKTGLLDLDLHGPSIPKIFGFNGEISAGKEGLIPPIVRGVKIMSLGLMVGENPLPLKGEDKRSALSTLLAITDWGELDHLVIDMPPGTGDETIFCIRALKSAKANALIVTTPSSLSLSVVSRLIELLRGEGINLLGLVENMAYFRCDNEIIRPFGSIDEGSLSKCGLRVLGSLPIDPLIEEDIKSGRFLESPGEFRSKIESLFDKIFG
ncbi:MAG: ATP-binding protein [Candidatus Korarchaeum sp.]|nr:ATP-binding protein [Candidatus Korarchaeum sp.]